jgi:hypothetical protein
MSENLRSFCFLCELQLQTIVSLKIFNMKFRFALMCSDIFENKEIVYSIIIRYLQYLAFDRIVNVRVTLAKVISSLFEHKSN